MLCGGLCSPLCDDQTPKDPPGAASPAHPAARLQASGRAWGSAQAGQQREQDAVPGGRLEPELRAVEWGMFLALPGPLCPRGSSSRCRGSAAPCPSVPGPAARSAGPAVPEPHGSVPRLCPCAEPLLTPQPPRLRLLPPGAAVPLAGQAARGPADRHLVPRHAGEAGAAPGQALPRHQHPPAAPLRGEEGELRGAAGERSTVRPAARRRLAATLGAESERPRPEAREPVLPGAPGHRDVPSGGITPTFLRAKISVSS